MIGVSLFVGIFGTIMDLPRWVHDLSPMEHTGRPPLDTVSWSAVMVLLLVAAGLMAVGLAGFRRRDLDSK